jgi:hypothetical protein
MAGDREFPTFAGRNIGTAILVLVQSFIGIIHIFSGLWLLSISNTDYIYSAYTAIFGLLTLFFAFGIWIQKLDELVLSPL